MKESTIIKQLRKWNKSKEQVRIDEKKLIQFIDDIQGTKKQKKCIHPSYGNGYGGWRDVCSTCWKLIDEKDRECVY